MLVSQKALLTHIGAIDDDSFGLWEGSNIANEKHLKELRYLIAFHAFEFLGLVEGLDDIGGIALPRCASKL